MCKKPQKNPKPDPTWVFRFFWGMEWETRSKISGLFFFSGFLGFWNTLAWYVLHITGMCSKTLSFSNPMLQQTNASLQQANALAKGDSNGDSKYKLFDFSAIHSYHFWTIQQLLLDSRVIIYWLYFSNICSKPCQKSNFEVVVYEKKVPLAHEALVP